MDEEDWGNEYDDVAWDVDEQLALEDPSMSEPLSSAMYAVQVRTGSPPS